MIDNHLAPYGALLMRVTLGAALLAHSAYLKVFVFTMPGTVRFFESIGLPGALAWLTVLAEIATGAMLVMGVKPRLAALGALPFLLGATWAHAGNGWVFNGPGGGWEYPAFWSAALVVQALIGDGAYALRPSQARGSRGPAAALAPAE